MAYADGELDAAERARVNAILATDQDARERLELFMATAAPIAEAYSKPMNEPVPPHLIALVMNYTPSEPARAARAPDISDGVLRGISRIFMFHLAKDILFGGLRWRTAVAWSTVVAITGVAAVGYLHHRGREAELVMFKQGQIIAQGPLKEVLDNTPSGEAVAVRTSTDPTCIMRTVLTFKNRRQAFCRQYNLHASSGDFAGIACRRDDGQWRLELHMAVGPKSAPTSQIRPAGGQTAAIEAAVGNAVDGDALGTEEEKVLIERKWAR